MPDDAAIDLALVRRARAAFTAGDSAGAQRAGAELWGRYEREAYRISRKVAYGVEAEEVLGHMGIRFTKWLYHSHSEPRNMIGLLNQMARYAAGDVTREEAGEAPTVEDIGDRGNPRDQLRPHRDDDVDIAGFLAGDQLERLLPVLGERERAMIAMQLEDAPDAEIAAALDVEPNNLHQIRFRAYAKLRAEAARQDEEAER